MGARRHPFDLLMELETKHIHLDCAALHLARDVYPHVDIPKYLARFEALAEEVAARRPGLDSIQRYEALRDVLVNEQHFVGTDGDLYDPENSYLNRVLDRGIGIPITLSVIWLEVARRLKWPVSGIGFPGHFLVRFDDPERLVIADPFNDGCSLSLSDCRKLLRDQLGSKAKLRAEHLAPIDTRGVLSRVLNNLRTVYMVRGDWTQLANILHRLAAVEPENGHYLCELAGLHAHLGNMRSAYAHLAVYLERIPDGDETALVRHSLQRLEAAISALN